MLLVMVDWTIVTEIERVECFAGCVGGDDAFGGVPAQAEAAGGWGSGTPAAAGSNWEAA